MSTCFCMSNIACGLCFGIMQQKKTTTHISVFFCLMNEEDVHGFWTDICIYISAACILSPWGLAGRSSLQVFAARQWSINCYLCKSTTIKSGNNETRVKDEVEWQLRMNTISKEAIKRGDVLTQKSGFFFFFFFLPGKKRPTYFHSLLHFWVKRSDIKEDNDHVNEIDGGDERARLNQSHSLLMKIRERPHCKSSYGLTY